MAAIENAHPIYTVGVSFSTGGVRTTPCDVTRSILTSRRRSGGFFCVDRNCAKKLRHTLRVEGYHCDWFKIFDQSHTSVL